MTLTLFSLILLLLNIRVAPSFEMVPKMLLWTFMCVCPLLPVFSRLDPFIRLLISPSEHSLTSLAHEISSWGTRSNIDIDSFGHAGGSSVGRLERRQPLPLWMSKWGHHGCHQQQPPPPAAQNFLILLLHEPGRGAEGRKQAILSQPGAILAVSSLREDLGRIGVDREI